MALFFILINRLKPQVACSTEASLGTQAPCSLVAPAACGPCSLRPLQPAACSFHFLNQVQKVV